MPSISASIEAAKTAMIGAPQSALVLARRTEGLASQLPPSRDRAVAIATGQWLEAEALIGLNQPEQARSIASTALETITSVAPNTKLQGDLLRSRGSISAMHGDALAAVTDYQRAYDVFRHTKVARSQAMTLQDMGQVYSDAGDYPRVLDYYKQAAEILDGKEPNSSLTMHNNTAEVLRKMHRYDDAVGEYRSALAKARQLRSAMLQTRVLTNLAAAQTEAGKLGDAQRSIDEAMALSDHGEAAGWQPFVYGIAASIAAAQGDNQRAARLFERTFRDIDLTKSDMMFRDYHEVASRVFEALGDRQNALAHLKAFQRLDVEARDLVASTSAQLVGAKFDYANQNLRIAKLKTDQLKREVEQEREKNWFWSVILVGLVVAGAIVLGLLSIGLLSMRRARDRIREINMSLTSTNAALQSANKAKTEFLATTSHELRTPLNAILGMSQVVLTDRTLAAELRGRVDIVRSAGETMRALVDDLLDVAKMESGELTLAYEPTDIRKIAGDAVKLWSGQAELKGVVLRSDIGDAPFFIVSDPARLRQIIFNLMSNALKFTLKGSVSLHVGTDASLGADELLVISVADTGIGIPDDKFEEIFESFKQVDGGTTRQFGGTGLGLSICRQLVEAMGGTIRVDSTKGLGTVFTVRLPLERVSQEAQGSAVRSAVGSSLAEAHMVLAVPVEANSTMLRMLLLPEVDRLDLCETTDEALVLLEDATFTHLVFDCDLIGPDKDFAAIVDALTAQAEKSGVRLSFLSRTSEKMGTLPWGGTIQMIEKPFNATKLLTALQLLYTDDVKPGFPLEAVR